MRVAPPFLLTHDQALRLHAYIQTYRHYAFTRLQPSPERNTTLRVLQTLQGKVIEAMDQATTQIALVLTGEEVAALQAAASELLMLYSGQPESAERIATLGDLTALKSCLKRYEG